MPHAPAAPSTHTSRTTRTARSRGQSAAAPADGGVVGTQRPIASAAPSGASANRNRTTRQDSASASTPPPISPRVMPSPGPVNDTPWPSPILSRGVTEAMMARSLEKSDPWPTPVISRAATSAATEPVAEQAGGYLHGDIGPEERGRERPGPGVREVELADDRRQQRREADADHEVRGPGEDEQEPDDDVGRRHAPEPSTLRRAASRAKTRASRGTARRAPGRRESHPAVAGARAPRMTGPAGDQRYGTHGSLGASHPAVGDRRPWLGLTTAFCYLRAQDQAGRGHLLYF